MKYKTVVIDPPWPVNIDKLPKFTHRNSDRWRTGETFDYSTMSLDDIMTFPIDNFTADDCILFLWVLSGKIDDKPCLKIGFELLEAWNFKYHQIITWCKAAGFAIWSPFTSRTEHVLVGYRGTLPKVYGVMPNYFHTEQQKHSEKPAKFYQLLRKWTPEPRIDIFARNSHYGFDGWGDEYVGEGTLMQYIEERGPLE
jgi:N6-adenosine-specific RNA methylase IME4